MDFDKMLHKHNTIGCHTKLGSLTGLKYVIITWHLHKTIYELGMILA